MADEIKNMDQNENIGVEQQEENVNAEMQEGQHGAETGNNKEEGKDKKKETTDKPPKQKSEIDKKIESLRERMKKMDKRTLEFANAYSEMQVLKTQKQKDKLKAQNKAFAAQMAKARAAKKDAILKNFFEDGLKDENDMKLLLSFRKTLFDNGITTVKELEKRLKH